MHLFFTKVSTQLADDNEQLLLLHAMRALVTSMLVAKQTDLL